MIRFSPRILLIATITALFTGCTSIPLQADTQLMEFSTATFVATMPPVSTPTIALNQPNTAIPAATQFCMGYIASWSCIFGDLPSEDIKIQRADTPGQCLVSIPDAYSITLPDNWYCHTVGVFAHNLFCLTVQGQHIFVQSVPSELPVEEADQAISIFQEGEGYYADPVVAKEEEKISRDIKVIQGRQVLNLLTQKEGVYILRNFIKNDDNLYIFKSESKDLTEIQSSTHILEKAINSMKFIQ